jgi:uncharacterized membrane protein YjjP (DUF1212 family)
MITTFHINEAEIDAKFIKTIKSLFKNCDLTLTIEANSLDTTEYLLSSPTNKARLLQSVNNVANHQNLHSVNLDELKKMIDA